jgi:aminoglycoside phosphotransferase family enzyme
MSPSDSPTALIVSWLTRAEAYREPPLSITPIETHMSWVFLADQHAYKLKKAIRQDGLDFSTSELRRRNCLEEVRLNRRLAPDVYYGVVPVTRAADGSVRVDGHGTAIDWVVHMRRLPADRNLEAILLSGRAIAEEPALRRAAGHLARFYAARPPERVPPQAHRAQLIAGVHSDLEALVRPCYGLPRAKVDALAWAQLDLLDRCAAAFDARVEQGRIVEGHGDLRPEHVWLEAEPAIIDCVEFDRALRVVDPADELAFFSLECERLGALVAGRWFLETYVGVTGDHPPAWLLGFYRVYRALRRATIAARHLDDPSVPDPARFLARARRYVEMVEPLPRDLTCVVS